VREKSAEESNKKKIIKFSGENEKLVH
jgi:hypothetical protein